MLRCNLRHPVAILAVTLMTWAGSGLAADLAGGYGPLDEGTMGSACGSNAYYQEIGALNWNCSNYNRKGNQLGSIQCAYKDGTTTYVNNGRACVVCSAEVPAWPAFVKLATATASAPLQASTDPDEMDLSCGIKTVGLFDLSGKCFKPKTHRKQPKSSNNVTPIVPQAPPTTTTTGTGTGTTGTGTP